MHTPWGLKATDAIYTAGHQRGKDACRYEEAFNAALDLGDISFVAWLCGQVEPQEVLASTPPLLSQQVLLVLLQQLGYDLSTVSHSQAL